MPKFIQFCDKVVPLINSGELELPIGGALERNNARIFKKKLEDFTEFNELLDAIVRSESFRRYYNKIKSEFDSEDWEDPDATHLRDMNWFAVEVIRTLLEDIIDHKKDPREMLKILSDYIDQGAFEAPIYVEMETDLKIEMDETNGFLDKSVKLLRTGKEKEMFRYMLSILVTVKFSDDYREVDLEKIHREIHRVLGKLITSLILLNLNFRLKIDSIKTYDYILSYPYPIWPSASWGLEIRAAESDFEISKVFTSTPPLEPEESEPPILFFNEELPRPLIEKSKPVQFNSIKKLWTQLNELESKIKGLDRRIIVIGKRYYQILVSGNREDLLLFFCMLLESLLLKSDDRDGVAHKFALRAGLLSAPNNKEIKKLFQYFENIYRIRSKILHARSIGELEINKLYVIVGMEPYSFEPDLKYLRLSAVTFSKQIMRRLLELSFIKSEIKSFDELIDFVDAAILDPNLREEIFKIK